MDRLVSLPYSYKSKDFVMAYRKPLMTQMNMYDVLQPQFDEQGRQFVTTYGTCLGPISVYIFCTYRLWKILFRMSSKTGACRCDS